MGLCCNKSSFSGAELFDEGFLPKKFHDAWENVNPTFDNEYDEEESRDPALASWRNPLLVQLQSALIGSSTDLEATPDVGVDDPAWTTN